MIVELADIRIKYEQAAVFERNVQHALATIFPQAKGFIGSNFQKCIETPDRYVLLFSREKLENHTVDFRGSTLLAEWRAFVGDFFAQPPYVQHFAAVAR
jgi:hypothetical protein